MGPGLSETPCRKPVPANLCDVLFCTRGIAEPQMIVSGGPRVAVRELDPSAGNRDENRSTNDRGAILLAWCPSEMRKVSSAQREADRPGRRLNVNCSTLSRSFTPKQRWLGGTSRTSMSVVLPFAERSLGLVMARHESYEAAEVARVLAPGGRFLTQQVDGYDAPEIHNWFGDDFRYPDVIAGAYAVRLRDAGMRIDYVDEWSGQMRFADATAPHRMLNWPEAPGSPDRG